MKTLTKKENRYRSVSASFWNFPEEVDLTELKFVGYLKHNGISKTKSINMWSFDTISFLKITEEKFIHCVALRGAEAFNIVLR